MNEDNVSFETNDIPVEKNIPVGNDDNVEFDVSIVDDTPELDRNRNPLPKKVLQDLDNDKDSDSSRSRALKKAWHDERRNKEQAYRELNSIVDYTKKVQHENIELRKRLRSSDEAFVNAVDKDTQKDIVLAVQDYKKALDDGDNEKIAEAQKKLTKAQIDNDKVQQLRYQKRVEVEKEDEDVNYRNNTKDHVKHENSVDQQIDPYTEKWMEKNDWYGVDTERTAIALIKHDELIKRHGVDIAERNPEGYFKEIDKAIKRRFPEYYEDDDGDDEPVNNVSRVSRVSTSPTKTKVKFTLTKSQEAIARKLNIPLEAYAKELHKLNSRG